MTSTPTAPPEWSPEGQPDLQTVFLQAREDAAAGRYADALAKRLWFHEHALDIDPAFAGVRLSYALQDWIELGKVYPPAMAALEELRQEYGRMLNAGTRGRRKIIDYRAINRVRHEFIDYCAINRVLNRQADTAEAFEALAEKQPKLASAVFDVAISALVQTRKYALCSRFLEPARDLRMMRTTYRMNLRQSENSHLSAHGEVVRRFGEQYLIHSAAMLVALLAVNGRHSEAERVAGIARRIWSNEKYHARLEQAMEGDVPAPWP